MKKRGWVYKNLICGHWYSGQIKAERTSQTRGMYVRVRHYRECQKCGKKKFID